MRTRCGVRVTVALAVAGTLTCVLPACGGASAAGALTVVDVPYDYCYHAQSPADAAARATVGTAFGVDALTLGSDRSVQVTSVSMVSPSGGLQLLRAVFVPGAEVGDGQVGSARIATTDPALADLARSVPATLVATPRPASIPSAPWNPRTWQLVVTVRAAAGVAEARTAGFVVTYRQGGATASVTTHDAVRLVDAAASCSGAGPQAA